MKRTIIATAIAAAIATSAQATEYEKYVTLGTAHTDTEDSVRLFDKLDWAMHAYTVEAAIGHMLNESTAVELSLTSASPFQKKIRPEVEQIRVNGFYFFGDDALKPYLTAGLGYGQVNPTTTIQYDDGSSYEAENDQSSALLSLGAGLQYDLSEHFFGRIEFRADDMINEHAEFRSYGLELGYRFGATTKAAPAPVVVPEPVVEPEPVPVVVEPPKPVDADNDGVTDDMDKCLGTPADVTVDSKGCPDFKGSLQGVNFQSGSANLTPSSRAILNAAAIELKRYPELSILVAAYTDSSGSDALNQKLSQKRAESVLTYLVGQGVAADKLTAKGFGEANPIATNDTKEGRAKNRRVELVVE